MAACAAQAGRNTSPTWERTCGHRKTLHRGRSRPRPTRCRLRATPARVNALTNELIIPNYKQTWGNIGKIADAPEGVRHLSFKPQEYQAG
jgi:hypothetical protein